MRTFLIVLTSIGLAAAPLAAQLPEKPGPPPESSPYVAWGIAVVLLGLVCAGAWKSSKRTHQD